MTDTTKQITLREFREAEGVEDWRVLSEGACAFFPTRSLGDSAKLVEAISKLANIDDHHPAVDLRHDGVTVRLITVTDDYYGMSRRDVELARQISAVARQQDLSADPSAVQTLLIIPGAPVTAEVIPFWRAVLGYEPRGDSPDEDLIDPHRVGPPFWFEPMDEPRRRDPCRRLGALRTGRGPCRGGARGRRSAGARPVCARVVDARRSGGQRGRHRHHHEPRLIATRSVT